MKRRVLIVDDVADIRLMLRNIIEKQDYVIVAEATNGEEAVEKYLEHLPDITIMDIEMPFKSGIEAAREILAHTDSARIIFCSGSVSRDDIASLEVGMAGHNVVRKPFLPAQLFQEMARQGF
jgi:two-component system, chemotaxis family, chemotaxis protein CheY